MTDTIDAVEVGDAVMTEPLIAISSDCHVSPQLEEDLLAYCPKEKHEAFHDWMKATEAMRAAGRKGFVFGGNEELPEIQRIHTWNLQTEGARDIHERIRDLDRDGVAGEIIFHGSAPFAPLPFVASGIGAKMESEDAALGMHMYNQWLADFCSVEPERNIGLAQLPFWDIDAAIAELEWCADHGLGGVNYPSPGQAGLPPIFSPEMDRFFAACAALEMTLATHIGALPPTEEYFTHGDPTNEGTFHFGLLDSGEWGIRTVYEMVIYGAFERHPNLKLVLTEVPGVFWTEMCSKMDSLHKTPIRKKANALPKLPSEYAATNVWLGNSFQSRLEADAAIDIGRADRFMWGSDYPHPEGTYSFPETEDEISMTRLSLAFNYHGLPIDEVRRLLGLNALDAFPCLDGAALDKVAARIGPTPAEIGTAPDLAQHAYVHERGTLAFREEGPWN
jgi:predicted TIM-barrel fold metal-dependent hydrolase